MSSMGLKTFSIKEMEVFTTEESRTVASLKGQLSKFSGIISKGFNKAKRRLIKEMLYGIQTRNRGL